MANATSGTVNALTANGFLADPAVDTLDTGTAAVSLDYDVSSQSDRVIFRIKTTNANGCTVTLTAGDYPPAFRQGVGDYVSATLAQNAIGWYGPFESSRFMRKGAKAGKITLKISPLGGDTIATTIQCFKLPKV